ncbi:MAG: HNH endonuclease [Bifidobacteriaceae bacterium]|nr:HNH endonuclease [Bifidobacteriaceae bacterium]
MFIPTTIMLLVWLGVDVLGQWVHRIDPDFRAAKWELVAAGAFSIGVIIYNIDGTVNQSTMWKVVYLALPVAVGIATGLATWGPKLAPRLTTEELPHALCEVASAHLFDDPVAAMESILTTNIEDQSAIIRQQRQFDCRIQEALDSRLNLEPGTTNQALMDDAPAASDRHGELFTWSQKNLMHALAGHQCEGVLHIQDRPQLDGNRQPIRCPSPSSDLDHIWPRSHGGRRTMANAQALCGPCNRRKLDTPTIEPDIRALASRRQTYLPIKALEKIGLDICSNLWIERALGNK